MGYLFVREECYARVASQPPPKRGKKGASTAITEGRRSASDIIGEALRLPDQAPHVPHPQPPRVLHGASTDETLVEWSVVADLASQVTVDNGQGKQRRQRVDTPILLGVVCSYPGPPDDKDPLYVEWRDRSVAWLRETYGDDRIITIVEHLDEKHGHLHCLVHNKGASVKPLHAGHAAAADAAARGESRKVQGRAYKEGERQRLDQYHAEVAAHAGLLRIGPARQRLSRTEYMARQRAAEAEASAAIEARGFVARARAEADELLEGAKRKARELWESTKEKAGATEEQIRAAWDKLRGREQDQAERIKRAEADLAAQRERLSKLEAAMTPKERELAIERLAAMERGERPPETIAAPVGLPPALGGHPVPPEDTGSRWRPPGPR